MFVLLTSFDNNGKNIREMRRFKNPAIVRKKKGDFVEKNMGLVTVIARQYEHNLFPYDDAIQEGCIGMLKAIDKFDMERGVQFSTYAYYWIRQNCARAAKTQGSLIRLPIYLHATPPSPAKQIHMQACLNVNSLDFKPSDDFSLLERTPSIHTNELIDDTHALLENLLKDTLSESEYNEIKLHFFEQRSASKDYRSVQRALVKLRRAARLSKYNILREQLRE